MTTTDLWQVYIIRSTDGKLYTGITNNLERRWLQHRSHKNGARFFHFSQPEKIVFQESHPNRSEASKREAAIKKMTKNEKLLLISLQT